MNWILFTFLSISMFSCPLRCVLIERASCELTCGVVSSTDTSGVAGACCGDCDVQEPSTSDLECATPVDRNERFDSFACSFTSSNGEFSPCGTGPCGGHECCDGNDCLCGGALFRIDTNSEEISRQSKSLDELAGSLFWFAPALNAFSITLPHQQRVYRSAESAPSGRATRVAHQSLLI